MASKPVESAKCIILAGGMGSRLLPRVANLPKCLAPINGYPFLKWQLDFLLTSDIKHFILALGSKSDQVIQAISEPWAKDYSISYIVEDEPLGTGGATKLVMDNMDLDEAIVINGDTILFSKISIMKKPLNLVGGEFVRLAATYVSNRSRFGGIILGEMGQVNAFLEKGCEGAGVINAGIYRIHRSVFDNENEKSFSLEGVTFRRLIDTRSIFATRVDGNFYDIGVPDDYDAILLDDRVS